MSHTILSYLIKEKFAAFSWAKIGSFKIVKNSTKYINPEINTKIVKFLLDLQCISPKYSEHGSVVFIFFNI